MYRCGRASLVMREKQVKKDREMGFGRERAWKRTKEAEGKSMIWQKQWVILLECSPAPSHTCTAPLYIRFTSARKSVARGDSLTGPARR